MRKAFLLTIVFFCLAFPSLGQPGVRIPTISGPAGSLLVAPILITPDSGVTAVEITVRLAQGLSLFNANSALRRGDTLADHSFTHSVVGNDVQIVVFSTSLAPLNSNGGSVVQLLLNVSQQANNGARLPLQIVDAIGSDVSGDAVFLTTADGEVTISGMVSAPIEGQNRLIFPQMANGTLQGFGSFAVTLIAVNLTDAPATASIRFVLSNGGPFVITLADGQSGSEFLLDLPRRGAAFVESNGLGNLEVGYAVLDASAPVGGTLLFTLRTPPADLRFSEAGVSDSPAGRNFVIPVSFERQSVDTGLAIANLGADASIQLTLRGPGGETMTPLLLPAGEHTAQFASGLFPLIADELKFEGTMEISSDQPISVVSLRQDQRGLFTTLPVNPLEPEP